MPALAERRGRADGAADRAPGAAVSAVAASRRGPTLGRVRRTQARVRPIARIGNRDHREERRGERADEPGALAGAAGVRADDGRRRGRGRERVTGQEEERQPHDEEEAGHDDERDRQPAPAGRAAADDPDRLGGLERAQDEGSPAPGRQARAAGGIKDGYAERGGVLDARHELDDEAGGQLVGHVVRDAVAQVADDPDALARDHDEPVPDRRAIDGRSRRGLRGSRRGRPRGPPRGRASRPSRMAWMRVRRRTSGRWSASSNSASLSIRPSIRT